MYVLAAGMLLGLRYWVLPNIGQWRPQIETYIGKALGERVEIGQLKASWRGLNPGLQLRSVTVYGAQGEPVLHLPTVSAVLGWRSVLTLSPRFLSLRVDGADITLRRDEQNRLWLAGRSFSLDGTDRDSEGARMALKWLQRQRDLALVDATIHWHDQRRGSPVVTLRDVSARWSNGLLSHRFALSAQAPRELAGGIALSGVFQRPLLRDSEPNWTGELYVALDDAEPEAWRPWLSMPVVSGRMAARAWLTWAKGDLTNLSADAAVRDLRWQAQPRPISADAPPEKLPVVSLTSGRVRLDGPPGSLMQWDDPPSSQSSQGSPAGLAVRADLNQLTTWLPDLFEPEKLHVDTVALEGTVRHLARQPLEVDVRKLAFANADLQARLHGRWTGQGKTAAGSAEIEGMLLQGNMAAIYKYLPVAVDQEVRQWLAKGLPAGQARNATVKVRGDLDDFPFEDEGDEGEFRIAGTYHDAVVDYAPPGEFGKGWPRLENMSGNFVVDKVALALDTPGGGIVHTGKEQTVSLGAVKASIPDMEQEATLLVDGQTRGPVSAYLALAANYELGDLIHGVLDEAEGTGDWIVPLKLEVPLRNPEDTKVDGGILFNSSDFRFVPEMPMLRGVRGELAFSEKACESTMRERSFWAGRRM